MQTPFPCIGFEWDQGNREKNKHTHGVSVGECEEVFFNIPLLLLEDQKHSQTEQRYFVLGTTNNFRHLFIAFTVRRGYIRVISARDMSKKERIVYNTAP